jgi:hypothetical protein
MHLCNNCIDSVAKAYVVEIAGNKFALNIL